MVEEAAHRRASTASSPTPRTRAGSRTRCGPASDRSSTATASTTRRVDLMLERDVPLVPTFQIVVADARAGPRRPTARRRRGRSRSSDALHGEPRSRLPARGERGVRVAMGTDGVATTHLPRELSLMVEHGLPPRRRAGRGDDRGRPSPRPRRRPRDARGRQGGRPDRRERRPVDGTGALVRSGAGHDGRPGREGGRRPPVAAIVGHGRRETT